MESEFLTLHESLSWATSQAGAGRGRPCPAGSSPVPSAPVPHLRLHVLSPGRGGESRLPVCTLLWTELSKVRSLLYKITS